ncbi:MAG: hypothetical protein L3J25_07790, partial [Flavobacteriaceae bacterium]|nr:hypothetical protein [Flavobacteriaceae bacterium]
MKTAINHNKIFKSVFLFAFLLCGFFVKAQVQEAFTPRFNENVKGDITIIANNMLSRTATTNYNGNDGNHDFTNNVYVDIDNDSSTFNSSSANFTNPEPTIECLAIKKVFLYWAAADKEQDNGDDNQPSWNYNDVKLMLPGQSNYTTITADDVIFRGRDTHFSNDPYICVKDITANVIGLGTPYGKYQIANVEAKTGSLAAHPSGNTGTSGGWQVVFIYESQTLPSKNITLFDGYAHVTKDVNDFDINFSGFQTAATGNVNVNVVIGSLEGDRDLSGDRLQIRNTSNNFVNISAPQRSSNNFFNSRITIGNSDFVDRNPASTNTLGFDAAVFTLDNSGNSIIGNNQTSATIRLTSNQETYGLYLIGLSADVWEPNFSPILLEANTSNTIENPGGIIPFTFNLHNNGNDDAINVEIKSTLPPQVILMEPISNLPSGVTYTYNSITNELTFNAQDGLLNVGSPELNIDFNLQVKDECYFLEDNCDLDFELQFIATYNGVLNPTLQSTDSSANLDACNVGDELPVIINILQPTVDWATTSNALDRVIECNDNQGLADALALFPETNKCDFILSKTTGPFVADADCPSTGSYTNTWSFTDACGVTIADYVQTITVIDTTNPTFVEALPADATVECDNVPAADTLTAIDNCGTASVTFGEVNNAGACPGEYELVRTWTATDQCGNETVHTQTITVIDTTNPTFVEALPADATVECDSVPAANTLTAIDNCGTATVTFGEVNNAGACPGEYELVRTWTATDQCGNETVHTQTITVVDTTAPTFTAPADLTINCEDDETNLTLTGDVTDEADNCDTTLDATYSDSVAAGSCANESVITRTWSLTDDCGNMTTHDQTITVQDITPPTIDNEASDLTVECDGSGNTSDLNNWLNTNGGATSSDICGNITWTNNYSALSDDCGATGSATVTFTATDSCGNASSTTATFTIEDTVNPTFVENLPTDATVECDNVPAADTLTATDNCCAVDVTFDEVNNAGTCPGEYELVRTWTATDQCGNETIHTQTITVIDTTNPTFVEALPADATVECDNVPAADTLTATDNCGTASVTFGEVNNAGACPGEYELVRTWTATD